MNPFQSGNAQDEKSKTERVTPMLYRVHGRLFERTGAKRQVQPGDWHWCDGSQEAPQQIGPPGPDGVFYEDGRPHICPIWRLAEDQEQDETVLHPKGIEWAKDPIDRLIQKVELTRESVEDSDILTRAAVLASLYQAQDLARIADALEDWPRPAQPAEWPWPVIVIVILIVELAMMLYK